MAAGTMSVGALFEQSCDASRLKWFHIAAGCAGTFQEIMAEAFSSWISFPRRAFRNGLLTVLPVDQRGTTFAKVVGNAGDTIGEISIFRNKPGAVLSHKPVYRRNVVAAHDGWQ